MKHILSAATQKEPTESSVESSPSALGGAFQKYLPYPDTETNRSKALYLIGQSGKRGEPGDKVRGG